MRSRINAPGPNIPAGTGGGISKGNQKLVKNINRNIILNIVRQQGPISRADAARKSQLYPATVSAIISDLIEEGFVREVGLGDSTGGRQPVLLELDPGACYACGVSIGVGCVSVCLTGLDAKVIARLDRPLNPDDGPRRNLPHVMAAIREILNAGHVERDRLLGVGVVYPGPVDTSTGTILASPHMPGWGSFPLKAALEAELDCPIQVDNDANAAALGEKWFGIAKDRSSFLYVMADHGFGAGMVIDDRLYRGHNGGAGEIGHMTVDVSGPLCSCGSFGCLHVLASGTAIAHKVAGDVRRGVKSRCLDLAGGDPDAITMEVVLQAAALGDPHAQAIVEESGRYLGIGLAGLVNCFNPDLIVLGGKMVLESSLFFGTAQETLRRRAWPALSRDLEVVPSALGETACMVGAAGLFISRVFESPSIAAYA